MNALKVVVFVICVANGATSDSDSAALADDKVALDSTSGQLVVRYRAAGGAECIQVTSSSLEVGHKNLPIDTVFSIKLFKEMRSGCCAPDVKFDKADPSTFYTLMMLDPDVPNPENPTGGPFLHWLVVNMDGQNLINGDSDGDVITEYTPPNPPAGIHRYQFSLYPQDGQLLSVQTPDSRIRFDYKAFEKKYRLADPVASAEFRVAPSYSQNK